jgi:hypothetical protein
MLCIISAMLQENGETPTRAKKTFYQFPLKVHPPYVWRASPPSRAAQARRAGMKVLKAPRSRGGKSCALIGLGDCGSVHAYEVFMD